MPSISEERARKLREEAIARFLAEMELLKFTPEEAQVLLHEYLQWRETQ
jgi:hypothetical protein